MILKFQVMFRLPAWTGVASEIVEAETAGEAERRIRALFSDPGLIVNVGTGRSDIKRVGLDCKEQAYALGVSERLLSKYKTQGFLPLPKFGRVDLLPHWRLEKFNEEQRLDLQSHERQAA